MDVVTVGESMVLFTPQSTLKYSQNFSRSIGGAESNVAIGLSRLGHKVGWISKVGDDEFGRGLVAFIRGEGVDVHNIRVDSSSNTGIYFKEIINGGKVNVQYYRKNSAASKLQPEDLNENYISNAKYLHITGITPALSISCHETIMRAIEIAKKNNVKIVFDPNLRKSLWGEEQARKILKDIAFRSDIFLPGIEEAKFLINEASPKKIISYFAEKGIPLTILKDGSRGSYYSEKEELIHVPSKKIDKVVDPVGAGDAFAAGLLSGLIDKLSTFASIKRGNMMGSIVVQTLGDVEGLPYKEQLLNYESTKEDINR